MLCCTSKILVMSACPYLVMSESCDHVHASYSKKLYIFTAVKKHSTSKFLTQECWDLFIIYIHVHICYNGNSKVIMKYDEIKRATTLGERVSMAKLQTYVHFHSMNGNIIIQFNNPLACCEIYHLQLVS